MQVRSSDRFEYAELEYIIVSALEQRENSLWFLF